MAKTQLKINPSTPYGLGSLFIVIIIRIINFINLGIYRAVNLGIIGRALNSVPVIPSPFPSPAAEYATPSGPAYSPTYQASAQ